MNNSGASLAEKMKRSLPKSLEWGKNTEALFRGLLALGPSFVLARAFTGVGQLIAGRLLGPQEFGEANLVIAASGVMMIPLFGFIPGMIKFASMEEDLRKQALIVSTAFWS